MARCQAELARAQAAHDEAVHSLRAEGPGARADSGRAHRGALGPPRSRAGYVRAQAEGEVAKQVAKAEGAAELARSRAGEVIGLVAHIRASRPALPCERDERWRHGKPPRRASRAGRRARPTSAGQAQPTSTPASDVDRLWSTSPNGYGGGEVEQLIGRVTFWDSAARYGAQRRGDTEAPTRRYLQRVLGCLLCTRGSVLAPA